MAKRKLLIVALLAMTLGLTATGIALAWTPCHVYPYASEEILAALQPSVYEVEGCSSSSSYIHWYNVPKDKVPRYLRVASDDLDNEMHIWKYNGLDGDYECGSTTCTVRLCGKGQDDGSQYDAWSYWLYIVDLPY